MTEAKKIKYRYFMMSFAVSFLVLSMMFLFLMSTVHPKLPKSLTEEPATAGGSAAAYVPTQADALTVLFIGTSGPDTAGTYILARFDPARGKVPITVLPPQTMVHNGTREQTLATVYQYGGADHTRNVLAATLNIPIDRYVRVSEDAFVSCASAIGSVEFKLPYNLNLQQGGMTVTLQKGVQLLDGKKVASIIRYEGYDGGELSRCAVTAELTAAIVNQRMDIALSTVADSVFSKIINLIDTDISYPDYDNRKAAAVFLAQLGQQPAAPMTVAGIFNEDNTQYTLADTFLARLAQSFG